MGIVLRWLSGAAGPYILAVVAILLVGSSSAVLIEHARSKRFQVERDAAIERTKSLLVSVTSKDKVIDSQSAALKQWKATAELGVSISQAASARAEQFQSDLVRLRSQLNKLGEKDNALPDCQKLLALDLGGVCPGAAARVRDWAAGRLQGQSGGDPNASGATGRP